MTHDGNMRFAMFTMLSVILAAMINFPFSVQALLGPRHCLSYLQIPLPPGVK